MDNVRASMVLRGNNKSFLDNMCVGSEIFIRATGKPISINTFFDAGNKETSVTVDMSFIEVAEKEIEHPLKVAKMDAARELLAIQKQSAYYDEYMRGMYNGMECVLAVLDEREPTYLEAMKGKKVAPEPSTKKSLRELIESKWNDSYLRLLSIHDHLRECLALYDKYKLSHSDAVAQNRKRELWKELMDLKILLDMEVLENGDKLYAERIQRFKEKLDGK